ncbi:hypothetical protein Zmor_002388 [Zophobas morio]|uniref:Odorant receptor n=1 Tax=Zophobas morio TaxID=2755281 RepID=A0AA38JA54_9CUCU|nr:hypothetical protein Zmor_002388 [Zophobas morio]
MKTIAERTFGLTIIVLKIVGFYPTNNCKILHKFYGIVLYIVAMIPVTILSLLHFVYMKDLSEFKTNDFVMVALVFYTFKLPPCLINKNKIKNCIHYFDDPIYSAVKEEHKKIIEECIAVCRRNFNVFLISCITGTSGFVLSAAINVEMLPVNVWLPKSFIDEPVIFQIVRFLTFLVIVYALLTCGTVDPLIAALCYQATAQIQILKKNLQGLGGDFENKFSSEETFQTIKKCAQHHESILNFIREVQNCFSLVVFFQFAGSSVVIAVISFQMSKVTGVDFLITLNDFGVLFFQIFFYCYYGSLLMEESNGLSSAIYLSRWYECDVRCKKALIVFMEHSKKPMVITAGRLLPLSLDTFTMVFRRAYSLVAVLKNY